MVKQTRKFETTGLILYFKKKYIYKSNSITFMARARGIYADKNRYQVRLINSMDYEFIPHSFRNVGFSW